VSGPVTGTSRFLGFVSPAHCIFHVKSSTGSHPNRPPIPVERPPIPIQWSADYAAELVHLGDGQAGPGHQSRPCPLAAGTSAASVDSARKWRRSAAYSSFCSIRTEPTSGTAAHAPYEHHLKVAAVV
jgi:hypothetical protein